MILFALLTSKLKRLKNVNKPINLDNLLPMNTAHKDRLILIYGMLKSMADKPLSSNVWHVGYWDNVDHAWCVTGATWLGPWIEAIGWAPLVLHDENRLERIGKILRNPGDPHVMLGAIMEEFKGL